MSVSQAVADLDFIENAGLGAREKFVAVMLCAVGELIREQEGKLMQPLQAMTVEEIVEFVKQTKGRKQ